MKDNLTVRPPRARDHDALANLKVEWAQLTDEVEAADRATFAADLATWMATRGDSLICRVAEVDHELVGMAWLVVFERVPDVGNRVRLNGDVQSVFVRPGHRSQGIGTALVAALCEEADARGLQRVTVSANELAEPFYRQLGFAPPHHFLQR